MSSPAPEALVTWLRACLAAGISRIEVRHMTAGHDAGSVVATFEPKDIGDGPWFDPTAIYARIEGDAENLGGLQRYVCLAFRDAAKTPRDRFPLRVDGGAGDGDPLSSEPANASGLVAQAHRHNEAFLTMLVRGFGTVLEAHAKQTAVLSKALESANEEKVEMWRMLGDIHKVDREKVRFEADLANEAKKADVLRDSLKLVLPGLISKVLPSEQLKKTAVTRLVESLTLEQRATIFSVLSPDQQVALGSLLDEAITEQETDDKKNGVS